MRRHPQSDTPNFFTLAREYLHVYLPTVQRRSPKTVEAYQISLECFLDYLADQENIERARVSFDHFDRRRLKLWVAWMSGERHYAPKTIALRLSAVKAFLAYCSYEELTLVAVSQAARAIHAPASPRKPIEYLNEDETRAVLAAYNGATAKSRRNRMLLILLYDTAARASEITDLSLEGVSLTKPGHVILAGKGNKTRLVPLTAKAVEHMEVYLAEFHPNRADLPASRPLFYSLNRGQPSPLSTDTVAAVLKQAARTARSACPTIPAHIHCHMLRKTKAMDLYQQGIPLPIIMRLLGHEDVSTTAAFYAFATVDMMRQAIDAATPAIRDLCAQEIPPDKLKALYSLR
jgi:integrase/recombinase XerD